MPKVPKLNIPIPEQRKRERILYCFPPGTSKKDQEHDIAQVQKFIAAIKAKRKTK